MQIKSGFGNSKVIDVPTPREIFDALNRYPIYSFPFFVELVINPQKSEQD
jgi:hypothetical protein